MAIINDYNQAKSHDTNINHYFESAGYYIERIAPTHLRNFIWQPKKRIPIMQMDQGLDTSEIILKFTLPPRTAPQEEFLNH